MKYITDVSEFAGKTIKSACLVDCSESIAILFDDDSCAYLEVRHYGDSFDIELAHSADLHFEREAGIISNATHRSRLNEITRLNSIRQENIDRAQLEELKAKYEGKE